MIKKTNEHTFNDLIKNSYNFISKSALRQGSNQVIDESNEKECCSSLEKWSTRDLIQKGLSHTSKEINDGAKKELEKRQIPVKTDENGKHSSDWLERMKYGYSVSPPKDDSARGRARETSNFGP